MRVLVYEFVTAGGWFAVESEPPAGSLLAEGRAMAHAVAADFAALSNMEVHLLRDARLPAVLNGHNVVTHAVRSASDEARVFETVCRQCDFTLLIAPEFSGHLLRKAQAVERFGGRLLSPASNFIALAGDKQRTCEHLQPHGVGVPRGLLLGPGQALPRDFSYPAVIKPVDGCGSLGVRFLPNFAAAEGVVVAEQSRLEEFVPGSACSVAILGNTRGACRVLEGCRQHLRGEGDFSYLGGSLPVNHNEQRRLAQTARAVAAALPAWGGYVGIDVVLAPDGRNVVVDVNPRLTTSYVGLRHWYAGSLAQAMLSAADGVLLELSAAGRESIQFNAQGNVDFS